MSRRMAGRVDRLQPQVQELAERVTEEQGRILAEIIQRSLNAIREEVIKILDEEGNTEAVRRIMRAWPGWVAQIAPEKIREVTGAEV